MLTQSHGNRDAHTHIPRRVSSASGRIAKASASFKSAQKQLDPLWMGFKQKQSICVGCRHGWSGGFSQPTGDRFMTGSSQSLTRTSPHMLSHYRNTEWIQPFFSMSSLPTTMMLIVLIWWCQPDRGKWSSPPWTLPSQPHKLFGAEQLILIVTKLSGQELADDNRICVLFKLD